MIKRKIEKILLTLLAAVAGFTASGAVVEYSPKGVLSFKESTPWGEMTAVFTYCLANKLFTFSSVSLDGEMVNSGSWSDNIGPFHADGYWVGANHLDSDGEVTAVAVSLELELDGTSLDIDEDHSLTGRILTIRVKNLIGLVKPEPFAWEYVTYTVAGNSIEVEVEHEYISYNPVRVYTYYGMQSMFVDERELLLPGTGLGSWIPASDRGELYFKKKEAPEMNLFIESNGSAMQATYLMKEDAGTHEYINDNDNIFVHSSIGKSYHSLMRIHTVSPGSSSRWHGVYSWFRQPVKDTFASVEQNPEVTYGAYISGVPCLVTATDDGNITTAPYMRPVENKFESDYHVFDKGLMIPDSGESVSIFDTAGRLLKSGSGLHRIGGGIYIINGLRRKAEKVRVR